MSCKPSKNLIFFKAFFTFIYIHLLAEIGEGVACQMKQDLFASLLKQDIAFYDQERTGELLNRFKLLCFIIYHNFLY